jgi:hypothetical protein
MVDHRLIRESVNNGNAGVSIMPADGSFDFKASIKEAYKEAIEAAGKYGNDVAEGRLQEEMNRALDVAESYRTSHQVAMMSVSATRQGSHFDRRRGWSTGRVELKVRCVVPTNLRERLYEKYALK